MKEEKSKKKKSLYYVLLAVGVLLLAAATVLTVWFTTRGTDPIGELPDTEEPTGPSDPDTDEPDEPTGPSEPESPAYVHPVSAEIAASEYNAIYVSETTGFIYRHKAVDFAAAAGTEVYAMAAGTVTEISMSTELGNLITIDHGEGLTTVYRFVEPAEGLSVGAAVGKGACIGTVSEPYGSEAADGAHLHFEIAENGTPVDPAGYLDLVYEEK